MQCSVLGIGVFGPGLAGWPAAQAVFSGAAKYERTDSAPPLPDLLPAAERRRATPPTRIALTAAHEALLHSGVDAENVPAVFSSSSGNPEIIHDLCTMLAAGDYQISPTRFHNSVHNAASGYYSIAVGSHRAVTTLCAFDGSGPAALLEAAVQATTSEAPVLMVCYDLPYPSPLWEARQTFDNWAVALVVAPPSSAGARAQIELADVGPAATDSTLPDPQLEAARTGNPAARLLPLVAALADADSSEVVLRQGNGRALRVRVSPR